MKWVRCFLLALVVSCGVTISPTLINDGNLAVTALTTLNSDAKLLGAPAKDTQAIDAVIISVKTALADLQKGIKTPTDFAQAVNDQISVLAPILLTDFKANTEITTGVVLLQQLVLVIAAEAANKPPTAQKSFDARAEMQAWLMKHKK